jgi:hypothetical protein
MATIEEVYHKGQWCQYKNATPCQEGFCHDCQIYKDLLEKLEKMFEGVSSID